MRKEASKKIGSPKIVVTGDVTIDWLEISIPPAVSQERQNILNWQNTQGTRESPKIGGALLLAEFVKAATSNDVLSPDLTGIDRVPPDEIIHSLVQLNKFPFSHKKGKDTVYRVKKFKGYSGPEEKMPVFLKVEKDDPKAAILILDDAGNGFRDAPEEFWPLALTQGDPEFILYKMSTPLAQGKLWEKASRDFADRLILIINADDLRRLGAKISRRVSWESTAKDFVWQMGCNPQLLSLNKCEYLIVRFGVEGAILYRRKEGVVEARLFYDPKIGEDVFFEHYPGKMLGTGAPFSASIASSLLEKKKNPLQEGVRKGLVSSRKLWKLGFGEDPNNLEYPYSEVFDIKGEEKSIMDVDIPISFNVDSADPGYWCILDDITDLGLEKAAFNYVIYGEDPSLNRVPLGRFRNLRTFSRSEIESLSNIKNLIQEYLSTPDVNSPISIAVFGPPGSGKSFAVTEVAKSVAPEKLAEEPLEFNLSQFNSTRELIQAFHRIRDVALKGKIPIVFFDEFDCDYNGKLGWLKYFLYPMNDGVFREGESVHPIGRAIFVFAGGTCKTFAAFSRENVKGEETDLGLAASDIQSFIDAKGPDFVSRLRGYINIKGADPLHKDDKHYLIRRAIIIRFLLQKNAGHIFDSQGKCHIDRGVLRAMIKAPRYKHGVRSIQAIIEMSMLAGRKSFEQAALPSKEQLKMNVDTDIFSRLVTRDVLLGGVREELAQAIHEKFLANNKNKKGEAVVPWNKLSEEYKETNRRQADDIPKKLKAVECDFMPVPPGIKPKLIQFTKKELDIMAKLEHEGWVKQKFAQGWSYGEQKDERKKTHPDLVGWDELDDSEKKIDVNAVSAIPYLLASKGFEIYRLK
jgi:hypothetical protein